MEFDREAPGNGVEASYRLENGKAFLEWKVRFRGEPSRRGEQVRIIVKDREGGTVAECRQQPDEEEALCSILLQPRLWRGAEDPWIYEVEAVLVDGGGRCVDQVRRQLPLRSLGIKDFPGGGLTLNGEALEPRAVRCFPPEEKGLAAGKDRIQGDLQTLLELGANCVCLDGSWEGREELAEIFRHSCDCLGLLAFRRVKGRPGFLWMGDSGGVRIQGEGTLLGGAIVLLGGEEIPALRPRGAGNVEESGRYGAEPAEQDVLLPDGRHPGAVYYKYRARWGREPFVYIVPESVRRLKSGNYAALCYSNCNRVALYSDGVLFEFKRGEEEFAFQEIPAKSPCIMLTAEGDGCSESLSVHKSFVARGTNDVIGH